MSSEEIGQSNLGFESVPERRLSTGTGGFLTVDIMDANSHTYVYDKNKELQQMTVEALPIEANFPVR